MAVFKIIAFDLLVIRHCQVPCMSMVIGKKMFEYYGNIHVCCPGVGTDVSLCQFIFGIIGRSPTAHFLQDFPFE